MKTIEERANDAYHFVESERQTAIGRENTGGWYFPNVYRNGYIKGATEQKAIDEEVIHAIVEEQVLKAINKQKAIDDANLAEVKRQRDEYYDELQKLRRHKVELIEWLNEEASRCRECAKIGYDAYEIGTFEGKYTQAEDTIEKIKAMEE